MGERALSVLGCSYADDILHDAPYIISSDMLAALHIDIVAEVPPITPLFSESTGEATRVGGNLISAPSQLSQSNLTASMACEVPMREGKHRWLSPPSSPLSSSHMILRLDSTTFRYTKLPHFVTFLPHSNQCLLITMHVTLTRPV